MSSSSSSSENDNGIGCIAVNSKESLSSSSSSDDDEEENFTDKKYINDGGDSDDDDEESFSSTSIDNTTSRKRPCHYDANTKKPAPVKRSKLANTQKKYSSSFKNDLPSSNHHHKKQQTQQCIPTTATTASVARKKSAGERRQQQLYEPGDHQYLLYFLQNTVTNSEIIKTGSRKRKQAKHQKFHQCTIHPSVIRFALRKIEEEGYRAIMSRQQQQNKAREEDEEKKYHEELLVDKMNCSQHIKYIISKVRQRLNSITNNNPLMSPHHYYVNIEDINIGLLQDLLLTNKRRQEEIISTNITIKQLEKQRDKLKNEFTAAKKRRNDLSNQMNSLKTVSSSNNDNNTHKNDDKSSSNCSNSAQQQHSAQRTTRRRTTKVTTIGSDVNDNLSCNLELALPENDTKNYIHPLLLSSNNDNDNIFNATTTNNNGAAARRARQRPTKDNDNNDNTITNNNNNTNITLSTFLSQLPSPYD